MAVLRSLVTTLGLNSTQYRDELKKSSGEATKWKSHTKKEVSLVEVAYKNAETSVYRLAGAIGGIVTIAAINYTARYAQEIKNMARIAGMSAGDFQAAAHATDQFGVSAEQLADISKDVREKLGEFVDTGGGGFKDFFEQVAPQVGITAEELRGLSGTEVLGRMVAGMEEAGLSADQMSFYLESVGNDATKLIPLFQNNSSKLRELETEFKNTNSSLTDLEIERLATMKTDINLATSAATRFATGLVVQVEPTVARVSKAIAEMFSGANEAFTVQSIMAEAEAMALENTISAVKERASVYDIASSNYQLQLEQQIASSRRMTGEQKKNADIVIATTKAKIEAVERLRKAEEQPIKKLPAIPIPEPEVNGIYDESNFASTGISQADLMTQAEMNQQWIEQLQKRLLTEKELIDTRAIEERERVRQEITNEEQKKEAFLLIAQNHKNEIAGLQAKEAEELKQHQQADLAARSKLFGDMADLTGAFAGEQSAAYKGMFAASKAFSIAETMQASFPAIAKAWGSAPFPYNMPAVATTTFETGALTAAAQAVNLTGIAHSGIDRIPAEGTWLLEKGERVLSPNQNADLTSYLSDKNNRVDSQGLTINIQNAPEGTTADYDAVNQIVTIAVAESEKNLTTQIIKGGGKFLKAGQRHLNWKREPSR